MSLSTKELSKEIMTRTRIQNNYLKNRYQEHKSLHVQQKSYCYSASKIKKKKNRYENLDEKTRNGYHIFLENNKTVAF